MIKNISFLSINHKKERRLEYIEINLEALRRSFVVIRDKRVIHLIFMETQIHLSRGNRGVEREDSADVGSFTYMAWQPFEDSISKSVQFQGKTSTPNGLPKDVSISGYLTSHSIVSVRLKT